MKQCRCWLFFESTFGADEDNISCRVRHQKQQVLCTKRLRFDHIAKRTGSRTNGFWARPLSKRYLVSIASALGASEENFGTHFWRSIRVKIALWNALEWLQTWKSQVPKKAFFWFHPRHRVAWGGPPQLRVAGDFSRLFSPRIPNSGWKKTLLMCHTGTKMSPIYWPRLVSNHSAHICSITFCHLSTRFCKFWSHIDWLGDFLLWYVRRGTLGKFNRKHNYSQAWFVLQNHGKKMLSIYNKSTSPRALLRVAPWFTRGLSSLYAWKK